jgi:chemotaxis protein CheZ
LKPDKPGAEVQRQITSLRSGSTSALTSAELTIVVGNVLETLKGEITPADVRMFYELEALAQFIQNAKAEIAAVNPHQIRSQDIPTATDELDAVVGATETATGTILDTCEALERVAASAGGKVAEEITTHVTPIYEACNFQDITGQRINKVVKTLKHIESRIEAMLGAFGAIVPDAMPAPTSSGPKADKDLLNGPQLPDEAKRQAEIDAILASFG